MQSDLNAFCQVIYFIHGYKIVDPLVHIWDNFAFGLSIVIYVKSSRVHMMQEYIDRSEIILRLYQITISISYKILNALQFENGYEFTFLSRINYKAIVSLMTAYYTFHECTKTLSFI